MLVLLLLVGLLSVFAVGNSICVVVVVCVDTGCVVVVVCVFVVVVVVVTFSV